MTELDKEPVVKAPDAMEDHTANDGGIMVGALNMAFQEVKNAKVEIVKISKAQEEMKETHAKEVDAFRKELVEEIFSGKTTTLESQKPFARERGEMVRQVTLRIAERDSANARYHEMLVTLRRIVKEREHKKD